MRARFVANQMPDARNLQWRALLLAAVVCLAAGLTLPAVAPIYAIDGLSMSPTFGTGDRLVVNRSVYAHVDLSGLRRIVSAERLPAATLIYPFGPPRRGDMVVFQPPVASSAPFLKRVIGEAGDRIAFRDGFVLVNAERLAEPYLASPETYCRDLPYCAVVVPAGMIYVLGDNRTQSADSRVFGPVALDSVIGEAAGTWFIDGWARLPG